MRTSDFDYHLPPELIAQTPIEPRDSSKLLVLHRSTCRIEHRQFLDVSEYVQPGDVMVFNQSRVIPARLYGRRQDTGGPKNTPEAAGGCHHSSTRPPPAGKVELLLLRREGPGVWQALGQPGRSLRPGAKVVIAPEDSSLQPILEVEVLAGGADGVKTVRLSSEEGIGALGQTPLPPYIHQRLADPERYQTVYAREPGSVAAPTAGLHFTPGLMGALQERGVELAFVTLHVGLDTFRPVKGEDPAAHEIHTEYFELGQETALKLNKARDEGRRIIAVGTTSVRVLEQTAQLMTEQGKDQVAPVSGQASLYILPGHSFRLVDAMITNFHLPRSTLLMLVSAFSENKPWVQSGRDLILLAYREAIERGYRFYSFGDAMLIV